MTTSNYEYSGFLSGFLYAPDAAIRNALDHIEIDAATLAQWPQSDNDEEREWQFAGVNVERQPGSVVLQGQFEGVRGIDHFHDDDPRFWVSLRSPDNDPSFPVPTGRYPIAEITYRCLTPNARPAWLFRYPGGVHFDGLKHTSEWRTVARLLPHAAFPSEITSLTLRLYSTARSTESVEIKDIRFRGMSPGEREAYEKHIRTLESVGPPAHYPVLDSFVPVGTWMKAGAGKRLAAMMELSFRNYWRMAFEDVTRHHHNCVAMEEVQEFSDTEWRELLALADVHGLRVLAMHQWDLRQLESNGRELVEKHIRPYAEAPALLAWSVQMSPSDRSFHDLLRARTLIEEADPKHPLVVMMRQPNSFPLFAPFFAAGGICHFRSHVPWELGKLVQTHYGLGCNQQFWVTAPAFVSAADSPEWSTCPEMRLMLNLAFAHGARGWFEYSYHNEPIWLGGSEQRSLTGPFLTFSDIWSEMGHRMERFGALTPLFLNSRPIHSPEIDFEMSVQTHPRARRPEWVAPLSHQWLEGPDFQLLHVISNEVREMTAVNLRVPERYPKSLEVYDITDFLRSRNWHPMKRQRHLEMFPGQGQVILVAEPAACGKWRDVVASYLRDDDRRQIALDLGLARRYGLEIEGVQRALRELDGADILSDLQRLAAIRGQLIDITYAARALAESRSKLIQASAAICGCDGSLCRLIEIGKTGRAHELGQHVLPLTRELNDLFVRLRRGKGLEIYERSAELSKRSLQLLEEIRASV